MTEFLNTLQWQDLVPNILPSVLVFLLAYPFVTCLLWSSSSLFYLLRRQYGAQKGPGTRELPAYTVVIPFHAEPDAALNSMRSLAHVTPQPSQIIIVDDGSPHSISHDTSLAENVRIVRLPRNVGKAGALQYVFADIKTEILVCMDADTVSESNDWTSMLSAFDDTSLAAVTGKIRPVNGGGLVEWFQALDYLTVIAVIKAAESTWGGLLTVSGAFTAYRASALKSVGGWNMHSSTEDIDASWRLQSNGWRLAFEKDWIARVEMAPSLAALWRQRRRWSAGLGRALRDHGVASLFNGARHLPIVVLTLTSLIWMVSALVYSGHILWAWSQSQTNYPIETALMISTVAAGVIAFYGQLAAALAIDGAQPAHHWRSVLIAPIYPLYFWGILLSSFIAGFPKGFLRMDKGTWKRTQRLHEARALA